MQNTEKEEEQLANVSHEEIQQFLTFQLDNEEYAVSVMQIMEIRGWTETTRLPNTRDFVLGIINLRGIVVPILDIRQRFGMKATELTSKSGVIILSLVDRFLGILVDSVSDILEVKASDIKAPPINDVIEGAFLHGLISLEKRMVIVLNTEMLFREHLLQQVQSIE
jgi:purine-binding chemotaxis protein CheW